MTKLETVMPECPDGHSDEHAENSTHLCGYCMDKRREPLVITRHPALVEYLHELGISDKGVRVIAHATENDVKGRHVAGVLPLNLAAKAASVTVIPLNIPPELRGVELTIEQVRQYAGEPVRYKVTKL